MKFDPKEEDDHRVRESDGWLDDIEDIPYGYGVFVFVDDKDDVKYIGKSVQPKLSQVAMEAYNSGKGKGATKLGYMITFSPERVGPLYDDLVAKYQPPNNK